MAEIQLQSNKLKALQNLAGQIPVANQKLAQGQAAARDIQLQGSVKAAPQTAQTAPAAAAVGAAQATTAATQMVEGAKSSQAQLGQVAQAGLAQQGQEQQAKTASLQAGAKQQEMDQTTRLGKISMEAKNELFDKQMVFKKDQSGQTLFNTRQLTDYAVTKSKSEEEYRTYAQKAEQINKRSLESMSHAFKLVQQDLDQKQAVAEQSKDQASAKLISDRVAAAQAAMQRHKDRVANRKAEIAGGFTILGAVVGAVVGGGTTYGTGTGAGAAAGGALGATLGGAVGGMAASKE